MYRREGGVGGGGGGFIYLVGRLGLGGSEGGGGGGGEEEGWKIGRFSNRYRAEKSIICMSLCALFSVFI